MATVQPCQQELTTAFVCTQTLGVGECDCFDPSTFVADIETSTRQTFLESQAFASPTDPGFCDVANTRVCNHYEMMKSCCCQAETESYRSCLIETVLIYELPKPLAEETASCQHVCPTENGSGKSNSISAIDVVLATVVGICFVIGLVGVALLVRRCCCRSKTEGVSWQTMFWWKPSTSSHPKRNDTSKTAVPEGFPEQHTDLEQGVSCTVTCSEEGDNGKAVSVTASFDSSDDATQQNSQTKECSLSDNPNSKKQQLKKKRQAIESWNKERKSGSNRAITEFLPVENDKVCNETNVNQELDSSSKEIPLRKGKRHSSRKGMSSKEQIVSDSSRPDDLNTSPSKRHLPQAKQTDTMEAILVEKETHLRRIAELEAQNKELQQQLLEQSNSAISKDNGTATDRPSKSRSSEEKVVLEKESSSRRLKRESSKKRKKKRNSGQSSKD